jgi:hypothetical protein
VKLYFTWVVLLLIQAYIYSEKRKEYETKIAAYENPSDEQCVKTINFCMVKFFGKEVSGE